jgi:hypothetical protein
MGREATYVPQDMTILSDLVIVSYEGVVDSSQRPHVSKFCQVVCNCIRLARSI